MKRGQVYYADFRPAIGSERGGTRPCVIIQNDTGNLHSPTVIVAPMTAKKKKMLPTHVSICMEDEGLPRNTIVLAEQLRTIDKRRILDFVCELSDKTMRRVDEAICVSLALDKEEEKMSELIHIGNTDIAIKEYKGKRVVTFKEIDAAHERPEGTANKRFLDNKKGSLRERIILK